MLLFQKLAEAECLMISHVAVYICKFVRKRDFFFLNLTEFTPDRIDLIGLPLHYIFEDGIQFLKREVSEQLVQIDRLYILFNLLGYRR